MGYDLDNIRVEEVIPDEYTGRPEIRIDTYKGLAFFQKGVFISMPAMRNEKPELYILDCNADEKEIVADIFDAKFFDEPYKQKIEGLENENARLRSELEEMREENEALRYGRAAGL